MFYTFLFFIIWFFIIINVQHIVAENYYFSYSSILHIHQPSIMLYATEIGYQNIGHCFWYTKKQKTKKMQNTFSQRDNKAVKRLVSAQNTYTLSPRIMCKPKTTCSTPCVVL